MTKNKIVTRIHPLSLALCGGILYALVGIVAGIWALISTVRSSLDLTYSLTSFVVMPLAYLALGTVLGWLIANFYNLYARFFKGIKIEVMEEITS